MSCSFAIGAKPDKCNIPASGGTSNHTLVNQCALKLAFKVRSSNNANYSVNITAGFLDVAQEIPFVITRKPGKAKADKLVIQFCDAKPNTEAAAHFAGTPTGEVVGETIIKISAAE